MNDYSKIYTLDTLSNNSIVTMLALPMEESIMVPVSQAIDLMKQGENVLYFTFNHDSVKIDEFFKEFLKNEENPESIKGNLGIIDAHQIPEGSDWVAVVKNTIDEVQSQMDLKYVFFDVLPYVMTDPIRPANEQLAISTISLLSQTRNITSFLIKTVDMPIITAQQKPEEANKVMDEFMSKDLKNYLSNSKQILQQSDFIISINRVPKPGFWKKLWKKIVDCLLFWRKRNNFTLKVIKNRNGGKKSYRMNLDMDNFKSEIL